MLNLFCKWVYNFEVFILYFSDVFLNMPLWLRGSKNIDYYPTSLVAQTVKHLSTMWESQVQSLGREVPWRRKWQSTPVLLPGKSHGQRSLVGYSPWGRKESDMTERLHFTFKLTSLSLADCILLMSFNMFICPLIVRWSNAGLIFWVRILYKQ